MLSQLLNWQIVQARSTSKYWPDIKAGYKGELHPELFKLYNDNFQKAFSMFDDLKHTDRLFPIAQSFKFNVARFAAFKSWHATKLLKKIKVDKDFDTKAKALLNKFNRWQAAEYNAVVKRARTAKQWEQFKKEAHLYPNLEWLRTRSADPRELHLGYVGIVLPQDHPFWNENQPGCLYNCKCSWKTTDAPVTQEPEKVIPPSKGLGGNPINTRMIFTDEHPYIKKGKSKPVEAFLADYTETTLLGEEKDRQGAAFGISIGK